ncbi:hypothetical protein AMJ49_05425 [Parcubacteria bacterium DG_74_2]|nr:MAG: hypothetical protein AMJ49_05425 [Parcubacteria bacterium DG_74_2]
MGKVFINKKGLIIAPGLETYLAVLTINQEKPSYIAFITDELVNEQVQDILNKINFKPFETRNFFIKQGISTIETVQEFLRAFSWLTERKHVSQVIVDATNTLKPRAISLYMTASFIEVFKGFSEEKFDIRLDCINCPFDLKAKPIKGKERLIRLDEPVDTIGFVLGMYAVNLFNTLAYSAAAKIFDILENKTSDSLHLFYSGLKKLSNAFDGWDKFQLSEAIEDLKDSISIFKKIKRYVLVNKILPSLQQKLKILEETNKKFGLHQIVDVYQNGNRRLERDRFDDATARFYCCLEMISRFRLAKFGIDTTKPEYNKLPRTCIEKFKKRNRNILPKEIDLKKGFELLECLNDPLGKEVEKNKKVFLGLIGLRNSSILAHGTRPITQKNTVLFKEKLTEKLLFDLLEQENVPKEKILNSHIHIKLPVSIKEFYKQL